MTDSRVSGSLGSRLVLVLTCAAQFMCVLDDTIVNVALPSVQRELGFSDGSLAWVVNGYLVSFGGLLLLAGRVCDLFVRRTVFLTGLVVFGAASMACGLAPTPAVLTVSRAVQGAGAAFLSAAALALLAATFTGADRTRALGVWGALSGVAGVAGMLLGGTLTSSLSWRWVFLMNVPVVVAVAVGSRHMPAGRAAARRPALDPLGALTVTSGLGLLIFAIVHTEHAGWGSPSVLACLAGAAALLAVSWVVETRHPSPLLPPAVFRLRNVSGGVVCGVLLSGAMLSLFFFLTLFMQRALGYSAFETGLAYVPMSLMVILVASSAAARLIGRFGFRPVLALGFALLAGALLWFARLDPGSDYVSGLLGPALVAGAGLGTTLVGVVTTVMQALDGTGESGLASGLVNTTQQLGGALGIAVLSALAFARNGVEGFHLAFCAAAGLALAGVLVALVVVTPAAVRG